MSSDTRQAWALGGTMFGATMMLVMGVYQVVVGIALISNDSLFVAGPGYTYTMDTTVWGWLHLGIGALAVLTGLFLFTGAMWARAIGIALAAIVAVANFVFLPYYPLWSMVIIAMSIFVIWSLASVSMSSGVSSRGDMGTMSEEPSGRGRGKDWSRVNEPSRHEEVGQSSYKATAEEEPSSSMKRPPTRGSSS
ncbi:hypothetical protein [Stackebrandtia soli]|uniref:DUF7144 family membrane protein n=1 Tax=Stackebrandtia soli TaxID=1892856 RepID=UPI0039E977A0